MVGSFENFNTKNEEREGGPPFRQTSIIGYFEKKTLQRLFLKKNLVQYKLFRINSANLRLNLHIFYIFRYFWFGVLFKYFCLLSIILILRHISKKSKTIIFVFNISRFSVNFRVDVSKFQFLGPILPFMVILVNFNVFFLHFPHY